MNGQITIRGLQALNAERVKRWHSGGIHDWTPLEWAGAMCGEAGEAANKAKKLKRLDTGMQNPGAPATRAQLVRATAHEIADMLIYGVLMAESIGADLETAVVEAFNAKSVECGFPERLPEP